MQQIGHSSLRSGIVNNFSSNNSAALVLQACLCFDRWAFWQSTLQYFTDRQEPHALRSVSALPQVAQQSNNAVVVFVILFWCFSRKEKRAGKMKSPRPARHKSKQQKHTQDAIAPLHFLQDDAQFSIASAYNRCLDSSSHCLYLTAWCRSIS